MRYVAGADQSANCANICTIHTSPMPGDCYQNLSIPCLATHRSGTYNKNAACPLYVRTYTHMYVYAYKDNTYKGLIYKMYMYVCTVPL